MTSDHFSSIFQYHAGDYGVNPNVLVQGIGKNATGVGEARANRCAAEVRADRGWTMVGRCGTECDESDESLLTQQPGTVWNTGEWNPHDCRCKH
jgi:hypothetical protein